MRLPRLLQGLRDEGRHGREVRTSTRAHGPVAVVEEVAVVRRGTKEEALHVVPEPMTPSKDGALWCYVGIFAGWSVVPCAGSVFMTGRCMMTISPCCKT